MIKAQLNYEASIIITNKNRLDLLKKCLESIEKYTTDVNYELIVVDSLSTDGTREYLYKEWQDKAVLIFEKDNTSYAASNNRAMKFSYGKYIYLLNNDCEATPRWLRNAIDFAEKDLSIGHVASLVLNENKTVQSFGANLDENGRTIINRKADTLKVGNFAYAGFGLYRRDVLEKVNYLPEYNSCIYWDDTGYGLKIWEAGYDLRYCPDSVICHKYHRSERKHQDGAMEKGRVDFLAEWGEFLKENKGFYPEFPFSGKRPYGRR